MQMFLRRLLAIRPFRSIQPSRALFRIPDKITNHALLSSFSMSTSSSSSTASAATTTATDVSRRTEVEWRSILTPMQFEVLRRKATEPRGFSEKTEGELDYELKKNSGSKCPKEGAFTCAACNTVLYEAKTKFDSGCGWPAFYEGRPGAVKEVPDADGRRIEIVCNNCDSHLGHVFKGEGFNTPTDARHCVNGVCLNYKI